MAGVALDANCIAQFQRERVGISTGPALQAVDHILATTYLILDEGKLCEQEWLDCIKGPLAENLKDWMADKMAEGGIRLIVCRRHQQHCSALRGLGFPKSDLKWALLIINGGGEAMVSEDIDFYDPAHKNSAGPVKERIKSRQVGPVARYFLRQLKAPVMRLEHVVHQI